MIAWRVPSRKLSGEKQASEGAEWREFFIELLGLGQARQGFRPPAPSESPTAVVGKSRLLCSLGQWAQRSERECTGGHALGGLCGMTAVYVKNSQEIVTGGWRGISAGGVGWKWHGMTTLE